VHGDRATFSISIREQETFTLFDGGDCPATPRAFEDGDTCNFAILFAIQCAVVFPFLFEQLGLLTERWVEDNRLRAALTLDVDHDVGRLSLGFICAQSAVMGV